MKSSVNTISIYGYKSFNKIACLPLNSINILIGSNGAGKSNLMSAFHFLSDAVKQNLEISVSKNGGSESHLFQGSKITRRMGIEIYFDSGSYKFILEPTSDDRLVIYGEDLIEATNQKTRQNRPIFSHAGHFEPILKSMHEKDPQSRIICSVYNAISRWVVYHFQDTSDTAKIKRRCAINDNEYLRNDGGNLPAILYRLQENNPHLLNKIQKVLQLVAPFFDSFKLRPIVADPNNIQLEWTQKGSDYPFLASHLSDGALRFICLATVILQPDPPSTILIDEPELGLHPYSMSLIASLIQQESLDTQFIISTQSPTFINHFEPEDIVVVERKNNETGFERKESSELTDWLEEYTIGELWQKNVLGGRPLG